ncbi:MAG: stage V sporulation protein AB [Lachnospiraceae bacterium]|jgi:stage V sporulation protein AB|nr:stage V sporulation protein AB [Lachnospiraceae bacterium]
MWIKQIFLALCGFSFGIVCSAGVFTVLVAVGLIPRFAGKFHVAKHILVLEEMVVFGTIAGGLLSIFPLFSGLGDWVLSGRLFGGATGMIWQVIGSIICGAFGMFAGMFVGCLALAIAEMLDSIPIFARRTGFREGIGIVIMVIALGKLGGSLLYFSQAMFAY